MSGGRIALAISILLITEFAASSQTASLFYDTFSTPGPRLNLAAWTTETGPASFLGRTQLADWVTPGGVGQFVVAADGAHLTLNTFNPTGFSFYGTQAQTLQSFQPATGQTIEFDTRLQLTSLLPGLVFGTYLYGCAPATCATQHDEIDIELVTNFLQPGSPPMVELNRYANEPGGAGNGGAFPLPAGFDPLAVHTWTVLWSLTKVDYLVDGVLLASATTHVPQGPMQVNEIAWAPSSDWPLAYSAALQPATSSSQNQSFVALLTDVTVNLSTTLPSTQPAVTSLVPAVSSGASQSYTFQFSDPAGYQALSVVNVLINNYLDGRQACYLPYSVPDNILYLVPDSGGGLLAGIALNASGTTGNSQCTVTGSGSSASGTGNTLTLTVNLSFNSSFAGNKVIYLAARDAAGNSGWQTMGVHAVPPLPPVFPNPVGMNPPSGTDVTQAITFTYQDQISAANLQTVWGLINSAIDGRGACYFAYYRPGNQLFLYPDNGDGSQAVSMTLSGSNSVSNGQCTISAQGSVVQTNGSYLSVTLPIMFKLTFAGPKGVWLAAQTLGGAKTSQWEALGVWTIPRV